jgi:two-component system phosphate regulon response regulator PhoB
MSNRERTSGLVAGQQGSASEDDAITVERHARLMLVTNDAAIGTPLEESLRRAGHEVVVLHEGRAALKLVRESHTDLIILDLTLPDVPGTEVCRALRGDRSTRTIPIIVVTSRADETDRVVAFEIGVDDFVTAPFSVREVLLRIRVLLRPRPVARPSTLLRVGKLSLDARSHRVWVEQQELSLSVREFRLLEALMTRRDRVLPRQALLDLVWGGSDVGARSVDAYVTRLRRKLGAARDYVETVSSVGYRLKSPND